jgi:hypothetical protein
MPRPSRKAQHRALLNLHVPASVYDHLLEYQGGGCAICGKAPSPTRKLDRDHDHKTMVVRGLLCTTCNRRLTGRLTAAWLRDAANYLDNPPYPRFVESTHLAIGG